MAKYLFYVNFSMRPIDLSLSFKTKDTFKHIIYTKFKKFDYL